MTMSSETLSAECPPAGCVFFFNSLCADFICYRDRRQVIAFQALSSVSLVTGLSVNVEFSRNARTLASAR